MRQRELGASTTSSRVWHGRHPATVDCRSIPQNRNVLSDHISAKNSVGSGNMEMGSSSGLRSRSHARLASWHAKHV